MRHLAKEPFGGAAPLDRGGIGEMMRRENSESWNRRQQGFGGQAVGRG